MRVVQVLTNLVGNALKYSGAGTPVDVRLLQSERSVTIEVEDRGRGIPADQLERVFDKFHRVEDPMRMTTGGTGLGLYIARELATAMGATLACRSTLGVGSVFSLTLPVAVAAAPAEAVVVQPASDPVVAPVMPRPRLVPPWEPLRATPGA
jgi:signal transduction histidine kinase